MNGGPFNMADLVWERAGLQPGAAALVFGGEVWSYGALVERAEGIARVLAGLLQGRGGRVGLFARNGPEYVAMALGILRAGGCLVPVPEELTERERLEVLAVTAPELVLTLGGEGWLPADGEGVEAGGVVFRWCRWGAEAGFPEEEFQALNPAFVRFSSGTTGRSKGVVLSHESLRDRVLSANRRLQVQGADRVLWTLPMAHHFAVSIMLYLSAGAATVLEDSHLAAEVLTTARAAGATVFYGSPFHLALLAAEDSGRDWPALRLAVGTAAALPREVSESFCRRFGVAPAQGLGVIEVGLPLLNTESAVEWPESVGRADDVAVKVVDEQGIELAAGECGEVLLRGLGMFDAYLMPWQPRAEATVEGWFATGDLGWKDAEGRVFLQGRKKSVINFGGMKFFPEEVEAVLARHPEVRECRVRGEAHDRWGAIPVADVVPEEAGSPPKSGTLTRFCREFLAAYKVPVRYVMVEALERTASGKIKR